MSKFSQSKTLVTVKDGMHETLTYNKYKLVVVEGPEEGREQLVDRDLIRVGSGPGNEMHIADDTVSRHHFEIRVTEQGHLIRDLGSTNGTDVEGCRINEAFLHPGARIGAGEVVLVFHPLSDRVEIPLSPNNAFGHMLGRSTKMRALFHLAERVAARDATVLITGETGTGKGLLAEEIHNTSLRAAESFVVVDCATIPAHLMESELFGHEKGAFTGAVADRDGAFVQADGGTIFFDEIGELPIMLQPKLLRALEKQTVKPVGTTDTVDVNVRILAATNRDLPSEVEAGRFREDLYFRLGVFDMRLPPLRERREDIAFLAREFLLEFSRDPERSLADDAMRLLERHDWPGNARELRNVIERISHLIDSTVIDRSSMMSASLGDLGPFPTGGSVGRGNMSFARAKDVAEKEYLLDLLRRHRYNVSSAARTAEIHRQSLHRLLRKHEIKASEVE